MKKMLLASLFCAVALAGAQGKSGQIPEIIEDTPRKETIDFFIIQAPIGGRFVLYPDEGVYNRFSLFTGIGGIDSLVELYHNREFASGSNLRLYSRFSWKDTAQILVPQKLYQGVSFLKQTAVSSSFMARLYATAEVSCAAAYSDLDFLLRVGSEFYLPYTDFSSLVLTLNPYILAFSRNFNTGGAGLGLLFRGEYLGENHLGISSTLSARGTFSNGGGGLPLYFQDNYPGIIAPDSKGHMSAVFTAEAFFYHSNMDISLFPLFALYRLKSGFFYSAAFFNGFRSSGGIFARIFLTVFNSASYAIDFKAGFDSAANKPFITMSFLPRW